MTNLGWMNGWRETPPIYQECRLKKHALIEEDQGPAYRGLEHVVKCEECHYVYRYDSSG